MDSTNRTFITMLILTCVFFMITTAQLFFKKEKVEERVNNEIYKELSEKEQIKKSEIKIFDVISPDYESEKIVNYENDKIKIEIERETASIIHAWIKNGKDTKYDIVDSFDKKNALDIKLGSWLKGRSLSEITNEKAIFNLEKKDNKFLFSMNIKDPSSDLLYVIEKNYTFSENEYVFKIDVNFKNNKNIPFDFDGTDKAFSIGWGPSIGVKSLTNGKRDEKFDKYGYYSSDKIIDITEKNKIFKGSVSLYGEVQKSAKDSWIVANSHYYSAVIIPDNKNYDYFFDYRDIKNVNGFSGFSCKTENSIINSSFVIYIGPKLKSVLKNYNNFSKNDIFISNSDIVKLDPPIMFGLGNGIGYILNFINKVVKNYGLSIIILTILIKIVIAPLTHKSMVSQQKMQRLQPKMKELQAKYKDKPEMLNKKTMELYKKEGINPMSGCLPLLLQMPILFAMYTLLDRMVELKGASFLWIADLAMPDAIINFGFNVNLIFMNISSLNILPILMVVTQIASSMMTPDMQNNPQAKMMMWMMPIMFFFFFYNVASGLVLYWTVMNILGIIQQFIANRMYRKIDLVTK